MFVREDELPRDVDAFRRAAAERAGGLDPADVALRLSAVSPPPASYVASDGTVVAGESADVFAKITTPGRPWHHAFTGSGMFNLTAACGIEGTVPHDVVRSVTARPASQVRIAHPGGVSTVYVEPPLICVQRSARWLFKGWVNVD